MMVPGSTQLCTMRKFIWKRLLSLSIILSVGLLPSCSGNTSQFAASGTIDETGGVLIVTSGPLTGTKILIPPKAVDRAVNVEVGESSPPRLLGFDHVGPGTNLSPSGMRLDVDGTATLVFDPELVPKGTPSCALLA